MMEKTKLVAGQNGMDNHIKWVTSVEIVEDIKLLQKGEFLITTGFKLMEDEERFKTFLKLLQSGLLSGVAICTSFYMKSIPTSFIEAANKHHLPLIEIPDDISFSNITRAILEQVVNKQAHLLEQSERAHHELSNLILNDQSLTEVTKRLAQLTSSSIIIFNEFHQIIYVNNEFYGKENIYCSETTFKLNEIEIDIKEYLLKSLKNEAKENVTIEDSIVSIYPIIAKQSSFGWIAMWKPYEDWQDLDDATIERATTIYAMEFLKKEAIEETQLRIQSNLLEDIFSHNYVNERFIIDQALKLDYDLSRAQCVFHLTFKQSKQAGIHLVDRLYHMAEHQLIQKNKQHIIQTKLNSIIFITNVNGKTKEDKHKHCTLLANDLLKEWQYNFPEIELLIGIGKDYDNVNDLGKSAQQAKYAITLHDLVDEEKSIVHYEDLGMYDLLLEMNRNGMNLSNIYKENISGLLNETDREIDLIETIIVYFNNNQSIQKSAEELFIHRHTLRYRLNQIEQRTNLNLKETDDLLKLQLGVMAYKLSNILDN